jgi:hypothetical protein
LAEVDLLREDARIVGDNKVLFGAIYKGFMVDIITTSRNSEGKFDLAVSVDSIKLVMKGDQIFKWNSLEQLL